MEDGLDRPIFQEKNVQNFIALCVVIWTTFVIYLHSNTRASFPSFFSKGASAAPVTSATAPRLPFV